MATFTNNRTGRTVTVADSAPDRTDRPGREKQWADLLAQMNRSNRWERVDASDTALEEPTDDDGSEPANGDEEPTAANMRAWAKDRGIDVPAKGRIPADVQALYKAERGV